MKISIRALLVRFKWKISGTVLLIMIENGLLLFVPLALGIAIDELLTGTYQALMYLALLFCVLSLVGFVRRLYDTRVYARIYALLSYETTLAQQGSGASVSETNSRVEMVSEFIEFLEQDMVNAISAVFSFLGALVLLAYFDIKLILAGIVLTISVLFIYGISYQRYYRLNFKLNNQKEKQVDFLMRKINKAIFTHFKKLSRITIKLSDLESINYGLVFLLISAFLVITLVITAQISFITAGKIFSILSYAWDLCEAVLVLPAVLQQLIRLREITHRIENSQDRRLLKVNIGQKL